MLSFSVGTVKVAVPEGVIVTVRDPVVTKSPLWVTAIVTLISAVGLGDAVRVKAASAPSVTALPATMLISGVVANSGWLNTQGRALFDGELCSAQ